MAGVEALHSIADNGVIADCGAAPEAPPPGDFVRKHEGPPRERIAHLGAELSPRPPCALLLDPPCDDVDLSQPASVADAWMCNNGALRVDPPAKGSDIPENDRCLVTGAPPCIFQTGAGDVHDPRRNKVAFAYWTRRVFLNEDGRALRDRRFRWWVLNTRLRSETDGEKEI